MSPDAAGRLAATVDTGLRNMRLAIGRRHAVSSARAERTLGWRLRPSAQTVVDWAESLLAHGGV
jgi:dihydroflavonol-4-reductase